GGGLDRTMLSSGLGLPGHPPPDASAPTAQTTQTRPPPTIPTLPKAPQLIVRPLTGAPPPAGPPPSPNPGSAAETPGPEPLEKLPSCLTAHVGPMARVLVRRHAVALVHPAELIEALANEIPVQNERLEFTAAARNALARPRA